MHKNSTKDWPEPEESALAHSRRLLAHLAAIIADQGPMPFSRYMQEVLYAPGLGYYAAGARKFGAAGDFVTAPEISPRFARCLAVQVAQVLSAERDAVLELGAGSGQLAVDLLKALSDTGTLPDRYWILEPSADLQERQAALISSSVPQFADRVHWLQQLPASFSGIIIGNEVLDAFPVERFSIVDGNLMQMAITFNDGHLHWSLIPADKALTHAVKLIEQDLARPFPEAYISEVSLLFKPWFKALSGCLHEGALLLLDYGYPRREFYLPERNRGSLRCYYRHRAHDNPLLWPGLQDITSHVDFTAVVEAAVDAGFELQGFTSQTQFLLSTGLLQHAEAANARDSRERSRLSAEVQTLTMPAAMGESFSAIGFSKRFDEVLVGFNNQDFSHRL